MSGAPDPGSDRSSMSNSIRLKDDESVLALLTRECQKHTIITIWHFTKKTARIRTMTPRQENILAAIVEAYAETAEPVGSLALSRRFGYSSATIRAEMAELENQGFITHPHTSAGRIPTDKGYRHYVNGLVNQDEAG